MSPKPVHRVPGSMKRRQQEVAPQLASYSRLANVLWPLITVTSRPNEAGTVVSTDSRGHRVTRMGDRTIRSDDAPEDAAFLLGGSFAFGVGASSDAGTLASALSMRTGVPYVNLGVRAAGSMQELVTALPFAERRTVFVVCSGVNNMSRSAKSGFDPLFGALMCDPYFETLSRLPVRDISRRLRDPLPFVRTRALTEELRRRLRTRVTWKPAPRPRPGAQGPKREKSPREVDPESAARLQLRDLRALRRLVPDEALVVFALQPFTPRVDKEWSAEEQELFSLLDEIQGKKWTRLRDAMYTEWDEFGATIAGGCRELGVPFLDLSTAAYTGWSFVNRVHATDRGYRAAAELLATVVPVLEQVGPSAAEPAPALAEPEWAEPDEDDQDEVYPLW